MIMNDMKARIDQGNIKLERADAIKVCFLEIEVNLIEADSRRRLCAILLPTV